MRVSSYVIMGGGRVDRVAFHDIPLGSFPFTVEYFRMADDKGVDPIHRVDVSGPGVIMVPPLAPRYGPVWVRITFANGKTTEC